MLRINRIYIQVYVTVKTWVFIDLLDQTVVFMLFIPCLEAFCIVNFNCKLNVKYLNILLACGVVFVTFSVLRITTSNAAILVTSCRQAGFLYIGLTYG